MTGQSTEGAGLEWVKVADLAASNQEFLICRTWSYEFDGQPKIGLEVELWPAKGGEKGPHYLLSLSAQPFREYLLSLFDSDDEPVGPVKFVKGTKGKRGNPPWLIVDA